MNAMVSSIPIATVITCIHVQRAISTCIIHITFIYYSSIFAKKYLMISYIDSKKKREDNIDPLKLFGFDSCLIVSPHFSSYFLTYPYDMSPHMSSHLLLTSPHVSPHVS